jgi:hypothetical protein
MVNIWGISRVLKFPLSFTELEKSVSSKAERIRCAGLSPVLPLVEPVHEETPVSLSPPSGVPEAPVTASAVRVSRSKKTKTAVSAVSDQAEAQPMIFIAVVPPQTIIDGPVSPSPSRLRIFIGDLELADTFIDSSYYPSAQRLPTSSVLTVEPENTTNDIVVPVNSSEGTQSSSTKVFGGGPKPGGTVGGCLGYNPTKVPPVMVSTMRRMSSMPNATRSRLQPPSERLKDIDDFVPSSSLSNRPIPIFIRRRRPPSPHSYYRLRTSNYAAEALANFSLQFWVGYLVYSSIMLLHVQLYGLLVHLLP